MKNESSTARGFMSPSQEAPGMWSRDDQSWVAYLPSNSLSLYNERGGIFVHKIISGQCLFVGWPRDNLVFVVEQFW